MSVTPRLVIKYKKKKNCALPIGLQLMFYFRTRGCDSFIIRSVATYFKALGFTLKGSTWTCLGYTFGMDNSFIRVDQFIINFVPRGRCAVGRTDGLLFPVLSLFFSTTLVSLFVNSSSCCCVNVLPFGFGGDGGRTLGATFFSIQSTRCCFFSASVIPSNMLFRLRNLIKNSSSFLFPADCFFQRSGTKCVFGSASFSNLGNVFPRDNRRTAAGWLDGSRFPIHSLFASDTLVSLSVNSSTCSCVNVLTFGFGGVGGRTLGAAFFLIQSSRCCFFSASVIPSNILFRWRNSIKKSSLLLFTTWQRFWRSGTTCVFGSVSLTFLDNGLS